MLVWPNLNTSTIQSTLGAAPLKIIPIGGIGEFGMNMLILEYEGAVIVIDAGVMFPNHDMPGIDIVIPDFSYLRDPSKTILGIFLTHGHEDHIGAIPYLLREITAPIYATPFTLALVARKLCEHRLPHFFQGSQTAPVSQTAELIPITTQSPIAVGPFVLEPISVTHSIVESLAFAITTPVGRIIHTGDFKIDSTSSGVVPSPANIFSQYGDMGVLALISDSTNAESSGHTHPESELCDSFDHLFNEIRGRIIIAMVSSHIQRLGHIVATAKRHHRKVFLAGRKIVSNTRIAQDIRYLADTSDVLLPLEMLRDTPDSEVVIVTTGSQAEPMSAILRIATDNHPQIQITPSDTVIFSSRMIPGHEADISRLINRLSQKGAHVLHEKNAPVHVSGHASQEELEAMIQWVRPQFFIPAHGEYRQLLAHAKLARGCGIPDDHIFVIHDGLSLRLKHGFCERGEIVPCPKVYIDGRRFGDIESSVLSDRRQLGSDGIVIATLFMEGGVIRSRPTILSRGLTCNTESFWHKIESQLDDVLSRTATNEGQSRETVEAQITKTLKKWIAREIGRYPVIIPNIVTLSGSPHGIG